MRLAQKLADRVLFLHEGQALYFGEMKGMVDSKDPTLRQFLDLDNLDLPA
jgi:phospholipid/cholesterol/gamma-HCH transport system ATP-binding protein